MVTGNLKRPSHTASQFRELQHSRNSRRQLCSKVVGRCEDGTGAMSKRKVEFSDLQNALEWQTEGVRKMSMQIEF